MATNYIIVHTRNMRQSNVFSLFVCSQEATPYLGPDRGYTNHQTWDWAGGIPIRTVPDRRYIYSFPTKGEGIYTLHLTLGYTPRHGGLPPQTWDQTEGKTPTPHMGPGLGKNLDNFFFFMIRQGSTPLAVTQEDFLVWI